MQNGWLRGDESKLDPAKSTPLEQALSLRESDFSPLPADHFAPATIPLYYEGHAYRAGSRIRVTISAPNGTQPIWAFAQAAARTGRRRGRDRLRRRHALQAPAPGRAGGGSADRPAALPGPAGEPCRDYQPLANRPAGLGSQALGDEPPAQGGDMPGRAAAGSEARGEGRPAKCRRHGHRKRRHGKHRLRTRRGKHRRKHGSRRCRHRRRRAHHRHHRRPRDTARGGPGNAGTSGGH